MRSTKPKALRELSLSSAQVFDQNKRAFWREDEKGYRGVVRIRAGSDLVLPCVLGGSDHKRTALGSSL